MWPITWYHVPNNGIDEAVNGIIISDVKKKQETMKPDSENQQQLR